VCGSTHYDTSSRDFDTPPPLLSLRYVISLSVFEDFISNMRNTRSEQLRTQLTFSGRRYHRPIDRGAGSVTRAHNMCGHGIHIARQNKACAGKPRSTLATGFEPGRLLSMRSASACRMWNPSRRVYSLARRSVLSLQNSYTPRHELTRSVDNKALQHRAVTDHIRRFISSAI
jgi:hypothetical protein